MKHNKIIFLDIDGVLCVAQDLYDKLNYCCMLHLERIIKETGAKIVVSSSWRCGDLQLTKNNLVEHGLTQFLSDQIVGETIRKYHHVRDSSYLELCRGNEIATYVSRSLRCPWHEYPEMKELYEVKNPDGSFKQMMINKVGVNFSYVILDDNTDMLLCQKDYLIRTFEPDGLNGTNADNAIEILNKIDKYGKS